MTTRTALGLGASLVLLGAGLMLGFAPTADRPSATGHAPPILSLSADGEILHLEPGAERRMILHLWNRLQHCERGSE